MVSYFSKKNTNSGLTTFQKSRTAGLRRQSVRARFLRQGIQPRNSAFHYNQGQCQRSLRRQRFSGPSGARRSGSEWHGHPHNIHAYYLGMERAMEHIGRINVSNAFYSGIRARRLQTRFAGRRVDIKRARMGGAGTFPSTKELGSLSSLGFLTPPAIPAIVPVLPAPTATGAPVFDSIVDDNAFCRPPINSLLG